MTRLLVTGATGMLGTDLVATASARGIEVVGCSRTTEPACDLTDASAVRRVVERSMPDAIVHAAAWTAVDACEGDPARAFAVNGDGTRHLAEAAGAHGVHLVVVSTDYVFDGTKASPYTETDAPNPRSVYGRSKLAGEQAVAADHAVARTSWLCGANGPNMVRTILRLAAEHEELRFVDDQVGRPTFTADLAPALIDLALARWAGTFHLVNQGAVSWFEFARAVMAAAGLDPARVQPVSTADLQPPRPAPRPANSVLDDGAWVRRGGAPLRPFHEPLADLVRSLTTAPPSAR